jgi:hypothetical protein
MVSIVLFLAADTRWVNSAAVSRSAPGGISTCQDQYLFASDIDGRQAALTSAPDESLAAGSATARWEVHCQRLLHAAALVMFQPDGPAVDEDGDGFSPPDDCDDLDPLVNPDADEICDDGVDNNCDGTIDEDLTPPEVTCPEDLTLECDGAGNVAELDAWLAEAAAGDNCEVMSFSSDFEGLADDCGEGGPTTVTWTAVDTAGNETSCSANITLEDTTPPDVSGETAVETLWPPNHRMMSVGLTVMASDLCDPEPVVTVEVVSDEDEEGPGNHHHPDAMDLAPETLQLRAERDGGGDGRVYLILVTAEDACGNTSQACLAVTVPHDQSAASADSVAAQAAAAIEEQCPVAQPPPDGFFMTGEMPDPDPQATGETDDKMARFLGIGCGALSLILMLPAIGGLYFIRRRSRFTRRPG